MKNTDPVANTKIYLATSFFNEEQRARIPQALAQLELTRLLALFTNHSISNIKTHG
ncbi:hypothetical protein M5361_13285 [Ligilactobacillus agilis]|nr:hypothetical protein [Ligilactobacillus agilis]